MIRAWAQGHEAQLLALEVSTAALHQKLVKAWNQGDATAFAQCFASEGQFVAFDGSSAQGPEGVQALLGPRFRERLSPYLVAQVKEVSCLGPEAAMLRAVAGQVTRGEAHVRPEGLMHQSLVVVRQEAGWRVALFQSTMLDALAQRAECQALAQALQTHWEESLHGG